MEEEEEEDEAILFRSGTARCQARGEVGGSACDGAGTSEGQIVFVMDLKPRGDRMKPCR